MKLGDLLKGVVGKNKYDREAYEEDSPELSLMQGYDSAIDKISDLSVCIDEEKLMNILNQFGGYYCDCINDVAKAISQSNCIVVRRA